ncbi:MAG: sulfotransferase family protein [Acidimicrobiales bacterium]
MEFTEPFFDETVRRCLGHPFRLLFRRETDMEAVRRVVAERPGLGPTGFIFHMSRCGSTLVSQMLAAVPEHLVLSEAGPLDSVLRARSARPDLSDAERGAWLRWMLGALGQPRTAEQHRLFVKFDAWSTLDLPLIRHTFPDVPWIFVHRDPVEVLVSHSRRRGAHVIPGVLPPEAIPVSSDPEKPIPLVDYAARVLARICEAALDMQADPLATFVDHTSLRRFVVKDLPARWSFPMTAEAAARMSARAERDAHNPVLPFGPDRATARAHASPEIEAAAERWLTPLYERLLAAPGAVGRAS